MVNYIEDLRERHGNPFIYAKECDLSSLNSIRLFSTKFVDNTPSKTQYDCQSCRSDGTAVYPWNHDRGWNRNPLGTGLSSNSQLLILLELCVRAQPPDRDIRILPISLPTCSGYITSDLDLNYSQFFRRMHPLRIPWLCHGASKKALIASDFQFPRPIDSYPLSDKQLNNLRIYNAAPGLVRMPGSRRWIIMGCL